MIRRKKLVITLTIVGIVLLLSISVAYAALSTTLTTTVNKVTQNVLTWDIGFVPGTITGVATSSTNSAVCGTATATATTISGVSAILTGTGDKCEYTYQIRNNGDIAAKVSNIIFTPPSPGGNCSFNGTWSQYTCGNVTIEFRYADTGSLVHFIAPFGLGDAIEPRSGSTPTIKTIVLSIEYTGATAPTEDMDPTDFSFKFTYTQN